MSLLSSKEKLNVLRMLAKAGGPSEITEIRNGVEIVRKMDGSAMKIVKSHVGSRQTTMNETTLALAMQHARRRMKAREGAEFPDVTAAVDHKEHVTFLQPFAGLDLDDLTDLLRCDPRRHSPLFQLSIWCGVLRALRAIHRRGFLHCDVRADNYCVRVDVRPNGSGLEVTPDFAFVHAVDFGCSLGPLGGRPEQVGEFPFIDESALYLSPQYCAARKLRILGQGDVGLALAKLTPSSDLWSIGYHVQRMLDADATSPDPAVEPPFMHAPAALELLLELPRRLGYPDGLPVDPTPMVPGEGGSLIVNVDLHDKLIEDIEKFTLTWKCGPVIVDEWPDVIHPKDETGILPPTTVPAPAPAPRPSRHAIAVAGVVAIAAIAVAAWKMRPEPAPAVQEAPVAIAHAPVPPARVVTMADCLPTFRELDAVLVRGQSPGASLQSKLHTALGGCQYLIDRPHLINADEARVALLAAGYYSLHLGLPVEAEQFAHQFLQRYPKEYLGHFLMAKLRASEGNAAATLEALTRAAERGLTRKNFDDERAQFSFLAGNPTFASLERRLK
ncbi:MAG: hypothetical protein JWQ07_4091 [Ramlibacter sp.]|nr:hypothetical protein [Ramlibacter sp.]